LNAEAREPVANQATGDSAAEVYEDDEMYYEDDEVKMLEIVFVRR